MQEHITRSPKAALALVLLVGSLFLVQIGALISNVLADGRALGTIAIMADVESDKVGATAAEFRVDESGAATYSIPLYGVPGTAGVAPKLSLSYSSQGGNGPLGKGWSIGGTSSIMRCRATREAGDFIVNGQPTDGTPQPINFTSTDRYCLDGQRLIAFDDLMVTAACPSAAGMPGISYRTEIESFQRVCAYEGGGTGPKFFTVERKDGSISWYGDRVSSETQNLNYNGYVNSTAPGKQAFALSWAQTRFQDSTGNYIDYVYWQMQGEHLLTEVRYTGKVALPGQSSSHAPYASLKFEYALRAPAEQSRGYVAGGITYQARKLINIAACDVGIAAECVTNRQARFYVLNYAYSASNSNYENLASLTECRDNTQAVCLPATQFAWSGAKHELATSQSWPADYFGSTRKFEGFKLGDVDGDGRQDMVWLKDGDSSDQCQTEHILVSFGELDTQGRQGFSAAQMTGCTPTELQSILGEGSWQLFDYTGDGREDLFIAGGGSWLLYPSQGRTSQPFNTGANLLDGIYIPRTATAATGTHPQLTDLNGDGLMDVIYQASGYRVRLMERNGAGFAWGAEREATFEAEAREPCPPEAIDGVCTTSAPMLFDPHQFRLNDFNGDAASDLLFTVSQNWREYCDEPAYCQKPVVHVSMPRRYWFIVSGTSATTVQFKRQSQVLADRGSNNNKVLVGDINADGLTDFVYQGSPYDHWRYALNTGAGFLDSVEIGQLPRPELVKLVDINGDGRSDLVFVNSDSWVPRYIVRYALASGGFGGDALIPGNSALPCFTSGCDPNGYAHIFTDLDADGALDYFTFRMQSNQGEFYVSQPGTGSRGKPRDVITSITNGLGARTELTYAPMTNSGIYLRDSGSRDAAARGRGSPAQDVLAPMYVVAKASSTSPQAGNPNAMATLHYRYAGAKAQAGGRGFLGFREISTIDPNHAAGHVITTTTYAQEFPYIGMPVQTVKRAASSNYAAPVCLGIIRNDCYSTPGQTFAPFAGIVFSDNLQSPASSPAFNSAVQAPLHPHVRNTLESLFDPLTGSKTSVIWTDFQYAGYGNVATTLVDTYTGGTPQDTHVSRVTTNNEYVYDAPAKWRLGRLSRSVVTHSRPNNPGGAVADVTRVTDFKYDTAGAWTGQLREERSQPGGTPTHDLRKVYTLDNFGNRTSVTTCNSEITDCTPNGLSFRPSSKTAVHRWSQSSYDALGRFPQSTTELFWDGFGAVPKVTQQVISRNIFGDVTEARDVNNVTAMATAGSFGRAFYTWAQAQPGVGAGNSAGGVESWTTYRLCTVVECPASAKFRQKVVAEGAPTQWTYFDVLGRPVMKAAETFNTGISGKDVAATCTHYEASGKPLQTSNPFFLPGTGGSDGPTGLAQVCMVGRDWNVTTFDLLGRPVKSQLIQSNGVPESEVTTSYTGLITTTIGPRAGMQTVQTRNGKGELTLVRDSVNTPMGYYYYADGSLWAVHRDAGRGVVSNGFQYDVLGRKTGQDDPDSGRTTFEYNALGELLAQVSNNERIENDYDARGRVWRKRVKTAAGVVESESTFDHDTAPNGIGQLAREQITGQYTAWLGQSGTALQFNRTYQYDGMGRPASSTTQIDGTNYPTAVQYDALGRASKSQDATGKWSKTEYTSRGFAAAVCFSDVGDATSTCATPWQRTREIDAWGHVVNEVRSSSGQLPITRQYHPVNGRIERICADKPGGGSNCDLVEEGYAWDKAGNLSTHQKEGRYLEAFEYDGLNRLWVGYALTTNGTQHAPWDKLTYWAQFDAFGNVCAKTHGAASGGQGYVYGGRAGCGLNNAANSYYGGTNGNMATSPHQVQTAGGASYSYDARGNQTFKDSHDGIANDRTIRYSVDDKAYEILKGDPAAPGQRTRFWYGPDGSRYKRGDGPRRTLYVGNVEIFIDGATTTLKRNIGGFLLQTIVGGAVSNQYLFHDQLGSVVRITDPLGNRLHNLDFVPSGERRNFDDPTQYNGTAPPLALTTRGFTGHEHVDGQNVIHMNGRIYDPQLGRFLQADPVIQSPGDNQSWNAYTYVFNNPLAYTDPTGMISQGVRQGIAAVVGIVAACFGQYYLTAQMYGAAFAAIVGGAFVAGSIGTQSLKGGLQAAFGAALTFGIGVGGGGFWEQVAMQAVSGGIMESLQGGNFGNGFLAAGLTAAVMPTVLRGNRVSNVVVGAIVGGTISEATGGKFANGAVSGAIQGAMAGGNSSRDSVYGDGGKVSKVTEDMAIQQAEQVDVVMGLPGESFNQISVRADARIQELTNETGFEYAAAFSYKGETNQIFAATINTSSSPFVSAVKHKLNSDGWSYMRGSDMHSHGFISQGYTLTNLDATYLRDSGMTIYAGRMNSGNFARIEALINPYKPSVQDYQTPAGRLSTPKGIVTWP